MNAPTPPALWGRDHASLMLYLESLVVDGSGPVIDGRKVGEIDKRRMRCCRANGRGHPFAPMPWQDSWGTRLGDGTVLPHGDDFDADGGRLPESIYFCNVGDGAATRKPTLDEAVAAIHGLPAAERSDPCR